MGIVYLAALIVGLGIVGVGLLGQGSDADGGLLGAHGGDADLAHAAGDAHHGPNGGGALAIFLSIRFWSFGLLAFGLVGSVLHWLSLAGGPVTGIVAGAVGLFSGGLASILFRSLGRSLVSSGGETTDVVGQIGRVLLPVERGRTGKIRIEVRGRLIDMMATTEGETLGEGRAVLVDRVSGTKAQVSAVPDSLLSGPDEG